MGALVPIDMERVRELHAQGWTCKAVADHLGIAYDTLNKHTRAAGLNFPPRTRIAIDMDAVREMHAKGWRLKAIATHFRIHYNTLSAHTVKAGLRFKHCPKPKPKPAPKPPRDRKAEPTEVPPAQSDHTRRFFKAWDEWDREMRADLKAKLWQQVQALRA